MKIFVTVGTTHFDKLIKAVDLLSHSDNDVVVQIADGEYEPKKVKWFRFKDSLYDDYLQADLIICHAGAGTIYQCLEMGKRLLIVPNLMRSDKHQLEIANYMATEGFALSCLDITALPEYLNKMTNFEPRAYQKDAFHGVPLIRQLIGLE